MVDRPHRCLVRAVHCLNGVSLAAARIRYTGYTPDLLVEHTTNTVLLLVRQDGVVLDAVFAAGLLLCGAKLEG